MSRESGLGFAGWGLYFGAGNGCMDEIPLCLLLLLLYLD